MVTLATMMALWLTKILHQANLKQRLVHCFQMTFLDRREAIDGA